MPRQELATRSREALSLHGRNRCSESRSGLPVASCLACPCRTLLSLAVAVSLSLANAHWRVVCLRRGHHGRHDVGVKVVYPMVCMLWLRPCLPCA